MFYSKSTGGFYVQEIHGNSIPEDAIEISNEQYQRMLEGQTQGLFISSNDLGEPILTAYPTVQKTYTQLRKEEYPSFAEQFDLIYHSGLEAWKDVIESVKAKYPKP